MSVIKSRLQEQVNGVLPRAAGPESNAMQELKMRVHRTLINRLDLTKLEGLDQNVVQAEVKKAIQRILDDENAPLSGPEREKVHADWEQAFQAMAVQGDDRLLDSEPLVLTKWEANDWAW